MTVTFRRALALALSLWAFSAFAIDRKEAASRYQKGVAFYKDGDYGAALAEFKAAYDAAPAWEVLYNIGLCERRLYKYGQAVRTYNRYLAEGGAKVPKDRRKDVERELETVRSLTASVTVSAAGAPATILVDGEAVGTTPLKEPVLLSPGDHSFRAERQNERSDEQKQTLVSGTAVEVKLELKPLVDDGPVEIGFDSSPPQAVLTIDGVLAGVAPLSQKLKPGSHEVLADLEGYATARTEVVVVAGQTRKVTVTLEPAAVAADTRKVRVPVAGLIVSAVGLGLIAGGVVFNLQAGAASREVAALYQAGGTWEPRYVALEASGQRNSTLSWVFGIGGGAVLATGLIITLVTLLSDPDEEPPAESLFLSPVQGGAVVGIGGRF